MTIMLRKFFILFLISVLTIFFNSCKTIKSINDVSEERGYAEIKRMHSKKNWEIVIKDVGDFRVRYPYSKHSSELELLQANSYFQMRQYPAAIVTYEDFIKRNPYDTELPFAYYRIAESYDRSALNEIDRDQTNTQKAIDKYKEFLEKFPNPTEFKKKAEERLGILNRRLAEHSLFIATFYWNKRMYAAALMRYLYIIDHFEQFPGIIKIARKNGAYCYRKLASMLEKHPKSEEFVFYKNETPQSLREKAKLIEAN